MLTAQEAKTQSQLTAKQIELQKRRDERAQEKRENESVAKALKEEVPFALKAIEKRIKEAITSGESEIEYSFSDDNVGFSVMKAVEDKLGEKGYIVDHKHYSHTVDYGDSAAPCVCHEHGYDVTINW